MAIVVGNVSTFGNNSFVVNGGRIKFLPSSAAVTGSKYILSSQPVTYALTDGQGTFSANLVATETTRPGTFYRIILETPDSEGNFQFFSEFPGELRVPVGAGPFDIADLLSASANPAMVWVGPIYPSDTPPSLGTWWFVTEDATHPDYGWLKEWNGTMWIRKADLRSYVAGPEGPRGFPGVNAVENDEAVSAYIEATDSETRGALEAIYARDRALDPRKFGAVGNGIANDTTALMSCITATGSNGPVELPPGAFLLDSPLILNAGTDFGGTSPKSTELRTTGDFPAIIVRGGQGQAIRNIMVSNTFGGTRTTFDIDVANPTKVMLNNVEVSLQNSANGTGGGIRFWRDPSMTGVWNAFMPQLSKVWIRNGHLVSENVTDGHVVDSWIWGPAGNATRLGAVELFQSNGWTFSATDVVPTQDSAGGSGYYIKSTLNTVMTGGYVDGGYSDNITGHGVHAVDSANIYMSGTHIYHAGRSGVFLENTKGSTFTGIGFQRNNKADGGWADIKLVGSSGNNFSGTVHSQPVNRTSKGRVYEEDAASNHNRFDPTLDTSAGSFYAAPLFTGNAGTMSPNARPLGSWPRASSTPLYIQPEACAINGAVAAWPAANRAQFHRFQVKEGGSYRYTNLRVEVAGGNVQAAVVRMDGLNYTRVMASAKTAASAMGHLSLDMGAVYLAPGEYALVMWSDSATMQVSMSSANWFPSSRLVAEVSGLSEIPASGAIGAWNSTRAVTGLTLTASA